MFKQDRALYLESFVFALLGCVLVFLCKPADGIMLTHDSVAYLHAADTFMAGQGFEYFGYSSPMVQWPLLMPMLFGAVGIFGGVWAIMEYVNIFFFGLAIFFGGLSASRLIKNRVVFALAMLAMTVSLSFVKPFYYLLSEGLFLMLLSLLLFLFLSWASRGGTVLLFIMSVTAGLLMWTRFTGIEFAGLIGLYILFFPGKPLTDRIKQTVLYGVVAGIPYLGLLLRNFVLSGTFTGRSKPSRIPFWDNVRDTAKTLGGWIFPNQPLWGALILGIIIAVCLVSAFLIFKKRASDGRNARAGISVVLIHTILYPVTVIYSNTMYALDPVGPRILAPMFMTTILSVFWLIDEGIVRIDSRAVKTAVIAAASCATIFAAVMNGTSLFVEGPNYTGYFREESFAGDPIIAYFKSIPEDVKIYSNKPGEIYFAAGKDANYPPRREGTKIYLREACDERLAASGKELYVAWYNIDTNPIVYQKNELIEMYSLELVESFENGEIYRAVES